MHGAAIKILSEKFSFHEELSHVLSQMYKRLHVQNPLFLSYVKRKLNFLGWFSKNSQISSFLKIRPLGAGLFHVDRQTDRQTGGQRDMTTLKVAFRNFMNAPKIGVRNSGEGIDVNIVYVASQSAWTWCLNWGLHIVWFILSKGNLQLPLCLLGIGLSRHVED